MLVYVFGVVDNFIVVFFRIHATFLDVVVVNDALAACDAAMFANANADASSSADATNVDVTDGAATVVPHTVVIFIVS